MITSELAPLHEVRTELAQWRDALLQIGLETDERWKNAVLLTHAIAWLHKLLPMEQREVQGIPDGNQIFAYLHCPLCLEEMMRIAKDQGTVSPKLYARYAIGWTAIGISARCSRHDVGIVSIDFEGAVHPARVG